MSGNQLVDGQGRPLQLRGVVRSGTEYACAQGWGIHDGLLGRTDPQQHLRDLVDEIASWGANAVRVPVNEHCWLGRNGVDPRFGGPAYRTAIVDFIDLLQDRGLVVVLAVMWTDAGDQLGLRQPMMANRDHSVDFWRSAGAVFRDHDAILFELFGEPHGFADWACWRDGCDIDGYPVAGMQSLVDAVRSSGARHPLILSGLRFANSLTGWIDHAPTDPLNRLVAGFHLYNFNACTTVACWEAEVAPVAAVVPLVTAELGEDLCTGSFVQQFIDWADPRSISYLAWAFNTQDSCSRGPSLLTNDGRPTPYGDVVRQHLVARKESP